MLASSFFLSYLRSVKILAFILAIIISLPALNQCSEGIAMPASETSACQMDDSHSCCKDIDEEDSAGSNHCDDTCLCYCCAKIVVKADDATSTKQQPIYHQDILRDIHVFSREYRSLVWEPPKVV